MSRIKFTTTLLLRFMISLVEDYLEIAIKKVHYYFYVFVLIEFS